MFTGVCSIFRNQQVLPLILIICFAASYLPHLESQKATCVLQLGLELLWIALITRLHLIFPIVPPPTICWVQKCFGQIGSWDPHEINHCSRGNTLGNLISAQLYIVQRWIIFEARKCQDLKSLIPGPADLRLETQKHDTGKVGPWNRGQALPSHVCNCDSSWYFKAVPMSQCEELRHYH